MGVSLSHGLDTGGVTHPATWLHAQLPYCHGILILIQAPLPQPPSRHAPWQPGLLCRRCSAVWDLGGQGTKGPGPSVHPQLPNTPVCTRPIPNPTVLSIQDPYNNTLHRSPGAYLPSRSCILNPLLSPHSQASSFRTQALSLLHWPFIPQLKCHSQRSLPSDSPLPLAKGFLQGANDKVNMSCFLANKFLV